MTHASLFTGIGGFDLAAQWMGWQNIFQVEIDEWCQKLLKQNFPHAERYKDIKEFGGGNTPVQSTCFPVDSPANHTVQQGNDKERKMIATSGQKCLESFGRFPRAGLWAKTFAGLLIGMEGWYSTKCRLTWKLRATKSSRFYFQLAPSTRRTEGIESGLLPTPIATELSGGPRRVTGRRKKNGTWWSVKLQDMAASGLLPTPLVSDWKQSGNMENYLSTKEKQKAKGVKGFGLNLPLFIIGQTGTGFQLSPLFVEEMMGYPIGWTELRD